MAEKDKRSGTKTGTSKLPLLDFERPIIELEQKIGELQELSSKTGLNLNGEVEPLKELLAQRVREVFQKLSPWQKVQLARVPARPLATDHIEGLVEDFLELHGDRGFRDDDAIITGIGRIGHRRVMIVAHHKGRDLKEKQRCNFGCAHPEGYRKALRKMRLAEKFGLPIVSFINTPGAYPGIGAEERGQAWAIAENLLAMFRLRVPIVCIVVGEGGSGGALGIGIGDRVLMLEHSYYSVISPEGCAAILWNDAKRAPEAADSLKLSAGVLLGLGVVDEIIEEPLGGAHRDPEAMTAHLGERIAFHLDALAAVPPERLVAARYEKFRSMGTRFSDLSPLEPAPAAAGTEEGSDEKAS